MMAKGGSRRIWIFAWLIALFVLVFAGWRTFNADRNSPNATPLTVGTIAVHPKQVSGRISPLIFGAGMEWTDHGNFVLDASSGHLRREIVEALKPIRIPVIRFPGGILADHYHWQDGVGTQSQRPRRQNPMDQSEHANDFGTDEFIQLCQELGSEALITVNAGTGSVEEAAAWQQYFRAHSFSVSYWEIGNEIYLSEKKKKATIPGNDQRIFKTADEYGRFFEQASATLKRQDPTALVGAIVGTYNANPDHRDWLEKMAGLGAQRPDFIALHNSFAPLIFGRYDYADSKKRDNAYYSMFAQATFAANDIRTVQQRLKTDRSSPVRIAITEHFPLFGGGSGEQLNQVLDQSRTLASALYTASLFHAYMREQVWMANYNLITSRWFGALVTDGADGLVKTPTYCVWDLYRNHFGDSLLSTEVSSPTFDSIAVGTVAAGRNISYLDAVASSDSKGSVYLAVLNRHLDQPVSAVLRVDGVPAGAPAETMTLDGPAANAINGKGLSKSTAAGPKDNVKITAGQWSTSDKPFRFPPHSLTVLKWKLRRS